MNKLNQLKKLNKLGKYLIVLVFGLALFLRLYKLGDYPTGFLWDEAALGYNAYSILKTGRDEYGELLPLIFKSFGDHKPGFYIYLTVPSVAVFGLNEFATRLPSALLGSFSVLFMYLLLKEKNSRLALIASLLLAISPWHLNFSRGAWELNVMTCEVLAGLYFLIKYLSSRRTTHLALSGFFWILTMFTYQSAKALTPALLAGFVFFFWREIKGLVWRPKLGFTAVLLAAFVFLNLLTATDGRAGRIKVMSVFSYPRSPEETQMIKDQDNHDELVWTVFHSPPVFFLRGVLGRYLNHFSGKFLFFTGDWSNPRNGIIYHGVLYFVDAVFILIGLGVLFSRKKTPLEKLMLFWLILAPLPSALTRDIISSVRSFTMVIPLTFLAAVGINHFLSLFENKNKLVMFSVYASVFMVYSLSFVRFLDFYFIHDPKINDQDRLYGYKQMIEFVQSIAEAKDKVVITSKYGQPYIFYLFYTKYDPLTYQKQAKLKESAVGDVGEVEKIDNIEFRKVYWPDDRGIKNSLFVDDEFGLPSNDVFDQQNRFVLLKDIHYQNGKIAFRIVETK
jgi:4-amino-4-deoxy-L-arabinose transferase-like glycosyltransferase